MGRRSDGGSWRGTGKKRREVARRIRRERGGIGEGGRREEGREGGERKVGRDERKTRKRGEREERQDGRREGVKEEVR